ncbi:MAG: acyl-CoA thioesterase [Mycobacterium sp.]|nr:acyl-CoA thioesterase [Mycobacterium sp.]
MTLRRHLGVVVGALALVVGLGGCASDPLPTPGSSTQPTSVAAESSSPESGAAQPPSGPVRYLSLGDSLTQGIGAADLDTGTFPALLAEKWRAAGCEVELQNVGISGYTAGQVLSDEVPAIADFQPTVITFQAGGNDIANGVSLDEYRRNVKAVLDAASDSGAKVIVLAQNEWYRSPDGQNYGEHQAAQRVDFDAALIDEANAHGAQFVDMHPLYKQQADEGQWVEDGLHPTPGAYAAWATGLAEAVPAPCR